MNRKFPTFISFILVFLCMLFVYKHSTFLIKNVEKKKILPQTAIALFNKITIPAASFLGTIVLFYVRHSSGNRRRRLLERLKWKNVRSRLKNGLRGMLKEDDHTIKRDDGSIQDRIERENSKDDQDTTES